ncbi:hypothetical protein HS048_21300 [Planomonospora sp. ID91781]|uniref:hypothetical protein n=1 Tax=Planomonospora TaxID=1998 RepID=UPI00129067BC|nr:MULTISPECIES: hypothetical protein [Planomonospora]MBG0823272.1 hypothetical protein [Planomonospora sp. ID91781]
MDDRALGMAGGRRAVPSQPRDRSTTSRCWQISGSKAYGWSPRRPRHRRARPPDDPLHGEPLEEDRRRPASPAVGAQPVHQVVERVRIAAEPALADGVPVCAGATFTGGEPFERFDEQPSSSAT